MEDLSRKSLCKQFYEIFEKEKKKSKGESNIELLFNS